MTILSERIVIKPIERPQVEPRELWLIVARRLPCENCNAMTWHIPVDDIYLCVTEQCGHFVFWSAFPDNWDGSGDDILAHWAREGEE